MDAIKDRHQEVHGRVMPILDEARLYDIVLKLTRLAVSPRHLDSWHDLVGYATLAEMWLKGEI